MRVYRKTRTQSYQAFPRALQAKEQSPVGAWTLDGVPYAEFRADGTCWVGRENGKWKADGKTLSMAYGDGSREFMQYGLSKSSLTVTMNGQTKVLARGKAKRETDPELAALLMSAPWCDDKRGRMSFGAGGLWSSGKGRSTKNGRWEIRGGRLWLSSDQAALKDSGNSISRDSTGYPVVSVGKKSYKQCR